MFLRLKRDQRSGGASSKVRRVTPGARGPNATIGRLCSWMDDPVWVLGKSESGAGKNHSSSCLSSQTRDEALGSRAEGR